MTLIQIRDGAAAPSFAAIGGDVGLAREVQDALGIAGVLDPPSDGHFGPVSQWALGEFVRRAQLSKAPVLDANVAKALLDAATLTPFPLNDTNSLAGRLVNAMKTEGHWLNRHPACINVIYVEGMDEEGSATNNTPNEFNDIRVALRVNQAGNPQVEGLWNATTEPGTYYTVVERLDPGGAARIAFGQCKSWSIGVHMRGRKSAHDALVQTAPIDIYRDLNADYSRSNDTRYSGLFGINQHWGYNMKRTDIGKASAGCMVGRTKAGHREFMKLCRDDPRYMANNSYRFMTAVLPAKAIS